MNGNPVVLGVVMGFAVYALYLALNAIADVIL